MLPSAGSSLTQSDLEDLLACCSLWVHHLRELPLDQWFSISAFLRKCLGAQACPDGTNFAQFFTAAIHSRSLVLCSARHLTLPNINGLISECEDVL